jgi:hypothetical protein
MFEPHEGFEISKLKDDPALKPERGRGRANWKPHNPRTRGGSMATRKQDEAQVEGAPVEEPTEEAAPAEESVEEAPVEEKEPEVTFELSGEGTSRTILKSERKVNGKTVFSNFRDAQQELLSRARTERDDQLKAADAARAELRDSLKTQVDFAYHLKPGDVE